MKEKFKVVAVAVVFLLFIPFIPVAFSASNHKIVEEVGSYVKEINKGNKWVLTNFWPSVFIDETGSYKTTWLSASIGDSAAFSTFPTSRYQPTEGYPSYEIMLKEGAVVILEELYSPTLNNPSREMPVDVVKKRYKPLKVFEDTNSNWPFFEEKKNTISVYYIEK